MSAVATVVRGIGEGLSSAGAMVPGTAGAGLTLAGSLLTLGSELLGLGRDPEAELRAALEALRQARAPLDGIEAAEDKAPADIYESEQEAETKR